MFTFFKAAKKALPAAIPLATVSALVCLGASSPSKTPPLTYYPGCGFGPPTTGLELRSTESQTRRGSARKPGM